MPRDRHRHPRRRRTTADNALLSFARPSACCPRLQEAGQHARGHVALEILACLRAGFDHAVVAPAFPFQGRITRGGRQLVHGRIPATGPPGRVARRPLLPGDVAPSGISLWDAATDADLDAVVAAGRRLSGRVLWCGTAGVAGALAGHATPPCPAVPRPILALIGSDHPTARAQLDACPGRATLAGDDAGGVALDVAVPPGLSRAEAARHIAKKFAAHLRRARPATCVVANWRGDTAAALRRTRRHPARRRWRTGTGRARLPHGRRRP